MKLTSNSLYYALALRSFEDAIVPELNSPNACGAADFIRGALRAAERRDREGVALLVDINRRGSEIVAALQDALEARGGVLRKSHGAGRAETDHFEDLAANYAQLNADLTGLLSAFGRTVPISRRRASDDALLRRAAEWECQASTNFASVAAASPVLLRTELQSRAAVEQFIQSVHPDGLHVHLVGLERISGGFGKQTYALTIEGPRGADHFILRKEDPTPLCDHRSFDLQREFDLVRAVNVTGFPSPAPLWFCRRAVGIDAAFYVMQRSSGRPPGSFLQGALQLEETTALEFAQLLARLHTIQLEALAEVIQQHEDAAVISETIEDGYRRQIADWRSYVDRTDTAPSPMLAYLFDWLECNVPQNNSRPVLVHGDFTIANVLIENGHVTAVLDWEAAMFGDPGIDLAYVRMALEKHIDWQKFVAHYVAHGGRPVNDSALHYPLAFQAMKVMVALVRGIHLVQSGKLDDIRLTIFELGILPQFMQIALRSTSAVPAMP